MAEYGIKEKDVKKESSSGGSKVKHPFPDIPEPFLSIILIGLVLAFIASVVSLGPVRDFIVSLFYSIRPFLIIFSLVVSALLVLGVIHSTLGLSKNIKEMKESIYTSEPVHPAEVKNEKWERVLEHIESENPGDWRLAILEADIMLEEMMDRIGFPGETLGEKLKNVERSDFNTIENAWEAHKVRNSIAHQGGEFSITHREAKRVVALFQSVFEEFKYI